MDDVNYVFPSAYSSSELLVRTVRIIAKISITAPKIDRPHENPNLKTAYSSVMKKAKN